MSALSDLEKQLNLEPIELELFKGFDVVTGLEYSEPVQPKLKQPKIYKETMKDAFKRSENQTFDPAKVASSLGVSTSVIAALFMRVSDTYKHSSNEEAINICKIILDGMFKNSMSRADYNHYINELNRALGVN